MRVRAVVSADPALCWTAQAASGLVGQEFLLTGYGRRVVLDAGATDGRLWVEFDVPAELARLLDGGSSLGAGPV